MLTEIWNEVFTKPTYHKKQSNSAVKYKMIIYGANLMTITAQASYQLLFWHIVKEGQIIECDNDELALDRAIKI